MCPQNDAHTLAPASLQLLQQLQATTSAATPVAANAGAANALSNVQHQLLLQQHLGLGAATPAHAAPPAVPSPAEINPANLQSLATLASLSNTAGEYGQCRVRLLYIFFISATRRARDGDSDETEQACPISDVIENYHVYHVQMTDRRLVASRSERCTRNTRIVARSSLMTFRIFIVCSLLYFV